MIVIAPTPSLTDRDVRRFWSKVNRSNLNSCWEWMPAKSQDGYGRFWVGPRPGREYRAHRIAYLLGHGSLDASLLVDHICRNRACVRPEHLRQVTQSQNGQHRGASGAGVTGVRGVTWHAHARRYQVQVTLHQRTYYGGLFKTLVEAEKEALRLRGRLHTHNDADRRVADRSAR